MIELRMIHKAVCQYYGLKEKDLFDRTRKRHIVEKRQIFQYLSRELSKYSLSDIGAYYKEVSGNIWDHASVMHAHKQIGNIIQFDAKLKEEVELIRLIANHFDVKKDLDLPIIKEDIMRILLNNNNQNDLVANLKTYLKAV